MQTDSKPLDTAVVDLPSPTVYPMVLALGISLICAGMVTSILIGMLGLVLTLWGSIGWFFEVLPREHHIEVMVQTELVRVVSSRTVAERLPTSEMHRKILPIETFHITTEIKGGIAGGLAMVVPATLFSVLKYHSIW